MNDIEAKEKNILSKQTKFGKEIAANQKSLQEHEDSLNNI